MTDGRGGSPRGGFRGGFPRRDERGSGTMLMITVIVIVLVIGAGALVFGRYMIAAHRARAAADLAALSGATAVAAGEDGCGAARQIARRSAATVSRCRQIGDHIDFVVTVTVSVALPAPFPGFPTSVNASADAGPVELAAVGR